MADLYFILTLVVMPIIGAGIVIGLVYRYKRRKAQEQKGASV